MRLLTLVLLASLAATLPAHAAKPRSDERLAVDLINRATRVVATDDRCQPRPPEGSVTHDAPSAELLGLFAILRRPATPEDQPPGDGLRFLPATDIYVDYIRLAHAADGRSYWIVAARDTLHFDPMPAACLHRIHSRLRRLARGEKPRVRRRALHFYNQMVRNNRRLASRKPREGVFVFEKRGDGIGGGGGGVGLNYLREHGEFGSSGTSDNSAVVNGLIPDGVATITSTFGTTYSRGPDAKPRRYPAAITRTDRVQDNIVSFKVARSAEDAFPDKMVWRDAGGKIVRVVRNRL